MFKLRSQGSAHGFLMTDTQVVDEKFLIYINSILASGWISGLSLKRT